MKNILKSLIYIFAIPLLLSSPSYASTIICTDREYVSYNSETKEFIFTGDNCSNLTNQDKEDIKFQIADTNYKLKKAINNANMRVAIRVADPKTGKISSSLTPTFRDRGITKVDVHWNYIRIYLSQDTARNLSAVLGVVGVWIPEGVASKILATVGVLGTQFAPAIWFDYNFMLTAITQVGIQ